MIKIHPSTVMENTITGDGTIIGANCSIGTSPLALENQWVKQQDGEVFIGENCFVGNNVVIVKGLTRETVIGHNVKIDSCVYIGNDCKIDDGTVIMAGCIIGDHVSVGTGCKLGLRCVVNNGIKIGNGTTLEAGSIVTKNIG